ncbi:MAG: hypothetical protein HYZ53_16275, partial [Planctomycetes bacterium]|nr:hypothetical protein [Planctomycetota bacterium]
YESVIHLESLATAAPERYGRDGNEQRFEPLERARVLELAAREAWARLPRRIIIDGRRGIEGKISEVLGILRYVLAAGP